MHVSYKQTKYWFVILLLIPCPSAALAQRQKLKTDVKEIILENRFLSRKFALDMGWLRTSHFANLLTGENLLTNSPEFQIQFENGLVLNSKDFVAEYYTPVLLANEARRTLSPPAEFASNRFDLGRSSKRGESPFESVISGAARGKCG